MREEFVTHVGQHGGQLNDNMTEFRRDQVSAANQLRDGVTTQIDRLVNSTTESDQQLRDVMQEKFAGLQQQVNDQLTQFRHHQGQTSEQLKESVQTNFSRLGSDSARRTKSSAEKCRTRTINRRLHGVEVLDVHFTNAGALLNGDQEKEEPGQAITPVMAETEL